MERTGRGRYETSLDDPEFTVMDDGTRFAGFFLGDGEDEPAVFPMEVTANYRFPVHYHKTHYMSIILRGSLRVGKKWYHPGDIRLQRGIKQQGRGAPVGVDIRTPGHPDTGADIAIR